MTKVDPFSLTTVPLDVSANGNALGSATGFIWKEGEQHYLITNWHVVTGRNARTNALEAKVQPDMLSLLFNTRIMHFGKQQYDIKIRDQNNSPLWYTHPVRQRGSDVVAVPLPMPGNDPIINMYPINTLKSEADLAVRIASEPDLTRIGAGYLLVDSASRPGMSGAPVLRRSWASHLLENEAISADSTPQSKFIGIYSGRLYTSDHTDAQLGMVWPVLDIQEVIWGKKFDE
jgi:hypothetical protein